MKVQVEIWYPQQIEVREKREIEIPDGVDPQEFIENRESALVEKEAREEIHPNAFELGYAGIRLLKECEKFTPAKF